jgi:RimJ/RimL family protein N-acetyltransferase
MFTDPDVRRYLWDDLIVSRAQVAEAIEAHFASAEAFQLGYWMVSAGEGHPAAGFCGFRFQDSANSSKSEVELLYGFLPQYWGCGFATESSRAALDYLWQTTAYPRVWAHTDAPNSKSVGVMQRLGMRLHSATPLRISYVMERPAFEERRK